MASKRITELTAGGTTLATDTFPGARSGVNYKFTVADLRGAIADAGSWTPILVPDSGSVAYGSGSVQAGRYIKIGKLIILWGYIKWGTGPTVGTGNYRLNGFPVTYGASFVNAASTGAGGPPIGIITARDASAQAVRVAHAQRWSTESDGVIGLFEGTNVFLGTSTPYTWAVGDEIEINCMYETDA